MRSLSGPQVLASALLSLLVVVAATPAATAAPATPASAGAGQRGQLQVLVAEAQQLFREASNTEDAELAAQLYRRALHRFLVVAEEGDVRNARLYYNIGNTYYRLGEIGNAILYYRRAELFDPADANLRHNLSYARSQRTDVLPSDQAAVAVRVALFWHYLLPAPVKLALLVGAFGAACTLGALLVLRRRRWKVALLGAFGGLTLLLLGSVVAGEVRVHTSRDGVIVAPEAVARKGDGTAYQPSFLDPLHAGTEFVLLEERAGWRLIRLPDGRSGWVPTSATRLVRPD